VIFISFKQSHFSWRSTYLGERWSSSSRLWQLQTNALTRFCKVTNLRFYKGFFFYYSFTFILFLPVSRKALCGWV